MAKIQIKSEKLTPLRGIFSSNGAIFPNTDFSDLSDYQMNQMNLYSFPLDFPNTDFSDLTDYQMNQMNLYSFQLVFSNTDFSDLSDYQKNQMNLYSFPQLDSTLSSVIYSTLGLRCSSFHFMARFLAMAELK